MKAIWFLGAAVAVAGCAKDAKLASRIGGADGLNGMKLTSTAFGERDMMPKQYTADGQDISPPLMWGMGPTQTKAYELIMEDPDAPGKEPFVHWIVLDLPANQTSLAEGASTVMASGSGSLREGKNSKGLVGYVGAEPPPGKPHRYIIQLFAVDAPVNLASGATKDQVVAAMKGHILTQGELTGTYKR